MLRQPAQQKRYHQPLEAQRGYIANPTSEPTLAAPEQRGADKENESAPHQP
jgi:hypothetical protein